MTRPRVDPHHGLLARPGRQAEDLAGLWIHQAFSKCTPLLVLDRQIGEVRLVQLLRRDSDEAVVDVMNAAIGSS
jgi:hypothetical protein